MSIYLYSGTPGSGKSYEAVNVVFGNLRRGMFVIANFDVNFTKKELKRGYDKRFFYYPISEITVEKLLEFAIMHGMVEKKAEHQCMVIIDEAGGRFNPRDYKESNRQVWIDFFSQHMKIGFDIILIAQMDRMIDRQIRGCIETEFKFRNINRFGPLAFLPMKVFAKVEYWYGVRERVGVEFRIFRKKLAKRYNRFKMFDGFKLSQELLDICNAIQKGEQYKPDLNSVPITAIYSEEEAAGQLE